MLYKYYNISNYLRLTIVKFCLKALVGSTKQTNTETVARGLAGSGSGHNRIQNDYIN